jgi:ethanolamine utilization protein EutP (predicted NTPase)
VPLQQGQLLLHHQLLYHQLLHLHQAVEVQCLVVEAVHPLVAAVAVTVVTNSHILTKIKVYKK